MMSLVELKRYMQRVKMASLFNISSYFSVDPDLVRCQLQHWMRKGCVQKCAKMQGCGSKCQKCPAMFTEMYEWVGV